MIERQFGEMTTLETRSEANDKVDRKRRYHQIISILREANRGMTAKEIAVAMYEKKFTPTTERNFSAPRLTELAEVGVVEPVGRTKCQYTGATVTVYKLR